MPDPPGRGPRGNPGKRFTSPHGITFDGDGNLHVMGWNATGRVSKLVRVAD